jgi:hypothetical protein
MPSLMPCPMRFLSSVLLLLLAWAGPLPAAGTLHGPVRIASDALGYDLQYWVYLPEGATPPLAEVYFTDGVLRPAMRWRCSTRNAGGRAPPAVCSTAGPKSPEP